MVRPRHNTRSTSGGLEVRGRGRATPSASGRGHATPTVRGRGSASPAARGRGCANLAGRGRGSVDPVAAVQAFQTFMGLFAGHQAQVTPANATRVSLLDTKKLPKLVTKALTAENDLKEEKMSEERQFKRSREWWQLGQSSEGTNSNKRTVTQTQSNGDRSQQMEWLCNRCGKSHYGYSCDGSPKLCYNCGQPGHVVAHCREKGDGGLQSHRSFQS
ncbi:hypothetical protein C3L33_20109, partial [Rhododendron williamsianum]